MIMKTLQNNMYKKLLIFGISLIFVASCEKEDDNGTVITYYKYKNITNEIIELKIKDKMLQSTQVFILEPNEEKMFESKSLGVGKKGFSSDFIGENEINIKFLTSNLCLSNFNKISNISLYDNFSTEMYNTNENTLLYLIDAEEVAAATVCN